MLNLTKLLEERARIVGRIGEIDSLLRGAGIEMNAKVPRSRPLRAAILAAVEAGPRRADYLATATGQTIHAVHQMVHEMYHAGEIERVGRGLYGKPSAPSLTGKGKGRIVPDLSGNGNHLVGPTFAATHRGRREKR